MRAFVFTVLILGVSAATHGMSYTVTTEKFFGRSSVNVVRMKGEVVVAEWRLWNLLGEILDPKLDTVFIISSPGGNAAHGLFLLPKIDDLEQAHAARGRRVGIVASGDCSSMCVPIYYAFENRLAVTGTRFGLHAIHDDMGAIPQFTDAYLKSLTDRAGARDDRDMLEWLAGKIHDGVFTSAKLDTTSADALARSRSGLVGEGAIVPDETAAIKRFARP